MCLNNKKMKHSFFHPFNWYSFFVLYIIFEQENIYRESVYLLIKLIIIKEHCVSTKKVYLFKYFSKRLLIYMMHLFLNEHFRFIVNFIFSFLSLYTEDKEKESFKFK